MKVVKCMYDKSETAVRCAAEMTEGFKVVGLHHGSTLGSLLFAVVRLDGSGHDVCGQHRVMW